MIPAVEQHRSRIADLCRRYDVRTLDLFGSAATGEFDAQLSDLDFMVEFSDRKPEGAADRYFGLLEGLQSVLGRQVDLVMRSAVRNPYFLRTADSQRQNLYAA